MWWIFLELIWEKPVITFYKERSIKGAEEAFVAVKARKLIVSKKNDEKSINCSLVDFFPIMGKLDYIFTDQGKIDRYVLCWFDDNEDDFGTAFRRLTGVIFLNGINCIYDKKGKITCNCAFEAKYGKLE
jgi:hypothetical protein